MRSTSERVPGRRFLRTDVRYMTSDDLYWNGFQYMGVAMLLMKALDGWDQLVRWLPWVGRWKLALGALVIVLALIALLQGLHLLWRGLFLKEDFDPVLRWQMDQAEQEKAAGGDRDEREMPAVPRQNDLNL